MGLVTNVWSLVYRSLPTIVLRGLFGEPLHWVHLVFDRQRHGARCATAQNQLPCNKPGTWSCVQKKVGKKNNYCKDTQIGWIHTYWWFRTPANHLGCPTTWYCKKNNNIFFGIQSCAGFFSVYPSYWYGLNNTKQSAKTINISAKPECNGGWSGSSSKHNLKLVWWNLPTYLYNSRTDHDYSHQNFPSNFSCWKPWLVINPLILREFSWVQMEWKAGRSSLVWRREILDINMCLGYNLEQWWVEYLVWFIVFFHTWDSKY